MPKIDDASLKILFLLLPGILAFFIVKDVGPKRSRTDFESGLHIFLYGIMAYLFAGIAIGIWNWAAHWYNPAPDGKSLMGNIIESALLFATLNPQSSLPADHVVYACLASVIMGLSLAKMQTHSVLHSSLRHLRLTKRIGEADMWGFTLNSPNIENWATVRHPNGRVYQGWIRGYSDGGDVREIILTDIRVYASSLETPQELVEVDSVPIVYLGLDGSGVIIELIEKAAS